MTTRGAACCELAGTKLTSTVPCVVCLQAPSNEAMSRQDNVLGGGGTYDLICQTYPVHVEIVVAHAGWLLLGDSLLFPFLFDVDCAFFILVEGGDHLDNSLVPPCQNHHFPIVARHRFAHFQTSQLHIFDGLWFAPVVTERATGVHLETEEHGGCSHVIIKVILYGG